MGWGGGRQTGSGVVKLGSENIDGSNVRLDRKDIVSLET